MMATSCEEMQLPQAKELAGNLSVEKKSIPVLAVSLAGTEEEVLQCQRLRYSIFAEEMGAILDTTIPGVDQDAFDSLCKHLVVRDIRSGDIVGTTRLLIGNDPDTDVHFYSETEFDIKNVMDLPGRMMEIGRTCIHPDYRNGSTIAVLWQGLARMMVLHDVDYLIGCASIPLDDGGANAMAVMNRLRDKGFGAPHLRVYPYKLLPSPITDAIGIVRFPSLLKAYLRLGAVICGEPFWDVQFNVADVFVLLNRDQIDRRYARHFIPGARQA